MNIQEPVRQSVSRMGLLRAAAFAAALSAALFGGCGGEGASGSGSSSPAKIGTRAEAAGVALTVEKVSRLRNLGEFRKAKDGREFLVAEVVIETTDRTEAPYNPLYFKVTNAQGNESGATLNSLPDSLKSGKLPKGEKVRGTVAFDVEQGANGFVLSYLPMVMGGDYRPIKVTLSD